jgi:hypothetical protein
VRAAICSVDRTISTAAGTIANAAEKKITGGEIPPTCSRMTVIGMKASNQWTEGLMGQLLVAVEATHTGFIVVT